MNSKKAFSLSIRAFQVLIIIFISFILCVASVRTNIDDANYLVLTKAEKIALDKLKLKVWDHLPEAFMKSDFYLIRWIRLANLDVAKAQQNLMRMIKWRQENKISTIIYEDFSDLENEFRMQAGGGRDKFGHPFGWIDLGEWDVRGAVVQGKKRRLQRYLTQSLELGLHDLFRAQKESSHPVTKGIVLLDGTGGNAMQHLCPQCLSILIAFLREMELYYPSFFWEVILFNAPSITAVAFQAVRPALSEETQQIFKVLGTDKNVWMKYLDERIDRSQRIPKYGGTKLEE